MIRTVRFSNFYSFNKEQVIDFTSSKKEGYSYYNSKNGDQITKVATFIGGNASGKTNVMRLLSFLSYFVTRSSVNPSEENSLSSSYKTFFNNSRPSMFEIEFELDDGIFVYHLELKDGIVLNESLRMKEIKKGARPTYVFKRNGDITLYNGYFRGIENSFLDNIRKDISLIAYIKAHYSIEIIDTVFNYFLSFHTNLNELGVTNNPFQQIHTLEKYLADDEIKEKMEEVIANFDIGLSGFEIKKKKLAEDKFQIMVHGIHNTKEKNKLLNFVYESRGTQSLFFLIGSLLSGIKNNTVIILDELETGLHPEAVSKLISYFLDENENSKAQLILTSHSFTFLNTLDMHQIYLTKKDENSMTSCKRLNEIEGARCDENFVRKYMAGKYGSFPNIMI